MSAPVEVGGNERKWPNLGLGWHISGYFCSCHKNREKSRQSKKYSQIKPIKYVVYLKVIIHIDCAQTQGLGVNGTLLDLSYY